MASNSLKLDSSASQNTSTTLALSQASERSTLFSDSDLSLALHADGYRTRARSRFDELMTRAGVRPPEVFDRGMKKGVNRYYAELEAKAAGAAEKAAYQKAISEDLNKYR